MTFRVKSRASTKSSAGRRRSESSHAAILAAAFETLEESGYDSLTIEGVAERAGVGKTTIYRWWPSKGALAMEAFLSKVTPLIAFPESASARQDIETQARNLLKLYRRRTGRILRGMIASGQSDAETLEVLHQGYLEPRREAARAALRRGIDSGELAVPGDLDTVIDAIYGPIFHRLLLRHAPLTAAFIDTISGIVLDAITVRRPPPRAERRGTSARSRDD